MTDQKRVYRSYKQKFIRGTNDHVEVKGLKIITIENDNYTLELPDHTTVKGKLTFVRSETNSITYETDEGCTFVISPDRIFVNLLGFNETATEYFLEDDKEKDGGITL